MDAAQHQAAHDLILDVLDDDGTVTVCMLIRMHSTSVRIDSTTHDELKRLASELNTTVGNTVAIAVRTLRQSRMGSDLNAPIRDDEAAWLDAELG